MIFWSYGVVEPVTHFFANLIEITLSFGQEYADSFTGRPVRPTLYLAPLD